MLDKLHLLPGTGSAAAKEVDILFFALVVLSAIVIIGVAVAVIAFSIRYRKDSSINREIPDEQKNEKMQRKIEYAWTLIPFVLFLITFFWGTGLYTWLRTSPKNSMEIYVTGMQWTWMFQHETGASEINELHVPQGIPVRLIMSSQDVIHSLFFPAFRIKQDLVPGRYVTEWFEATNNGEFRFTCAEYCGTNHSRMSGSLVVMEPDEFKKWLHENSPSQSDMVDQGRQNYEKYGCNGCHDPGSKIRSPSLKRLFGKTIVLEAGGTILADERYIHDSITQPRKQIAADYDPVMPSFEGQISQEEIMQIIVYIKSLGLEGSSSGGTQ